MMSEDRAEVAKWAGFTSAELRVMQICFGSADRTLLYSQVTREIERRKGEKSAA